MSNRATPKHAVTPPKGRPTRSRHDLGGRRRVFGPTMQWLATVALFAVAFAILFLQFD